MAFCPNCGASLEDGAKFCTSCGASMTAANQPEQPASAPAGESSAPQQAPDSQPNPQPAPQPQPSSPAGKNYEKLGGWLLFFVICYGISAALGLYRAVDTVGLAGMLLTYHGNFVLPVICGVLTNLLTVVAGVLYIVLIVKKHPNFLRLFQIIRIAVVGANFLLTVIAGLGYGGGAAMYFAEAFGLLVSGGLGIFLMTLYFCKSERVRVYMGTTEYLDTALFKIGA